jgi:plastocyanin
MKILMRPIAFIALALALAACASTNSQEAQSPTPPPAMESVVPSAPISPGASPSASPEATHDMGGMEHNGDEAVVEVAGFAYEPADLTITAGTTVVFQNNDTAPHTITAGSNDDPQPDLFDSGLLQQGESFPFVFDEPGTYTYFCDRHPPMRGLITVEG